MPWSLILLFLMGECCFIDCHLYEYHYIREKKSWTEAQQYCRKKHTDLATVTNMTDMERLLNISAGSHAWIGLYRKQNSESTWNWSLPGVEFNERETNWTSGVSNDEGKNCVILLKNLQWENRPCKTPGYFICYNETNTTHKYHLIKEKKSWQEAQSYCREKHTDLISGLKQLKDEELKIVMNSTGNEPVYIGLFRDRWRWSDGSSFSFRHWHEDVNNQEPNSDQCPVTGDEGGLKSESCDQKKNFICYDDKVILIKENKTSEDSLNNCGDHYHYLVTITNLDEQRLVQEKAKNASTAYVWIGLHYDGNLDFWSWVNAKVACYTKLCSDEQMDDCDTSVATELGGGH